MCIVSFLWISSQGNSPIMVTPKWDSFIGRTSSLSGALNILPHQHYWVFWFSYWGNPVHGAGFASCVTIFRVFNVYWFKSLHSHIMTKQKPLCFISWFLLTILKLCLATKSLVIHILHNSTANHRFMKLTLLLLWEPRNSELSQ